MFNSKDIKFQNPFLSADGLSEKKYTDDEFLDSLVDNVTEILKQRFPGDLNRQRVRRGTNGLNFACPFCGDSAISSTRKRGHIIMTGKYKGNYKCFNCGQFMSLMSFMKRYKRELDLGQIDYIINNTSKEYKKNTSTNGYTDSSYFKIDEVRKYSVSKQELLNKHGLYPVTPNDVAGRYLKSRFQYDFDNYLYDPNGQWLVILNRIDNDNVIGFQVRDMSGKRKAKYLTMTLSKIHQNILKDNVEVPVWLDNISTVFNLFRINLEKPLIVTEGPFDANLLPNAIALSGANKNSNVVPVRLYYLFDDDDTGRKIAVNMIEHGQMVFLWAKFKRDYGLPDRKKWDVNDVIKYFRENNINVQPSWLSYFSDDMLDTIDI